MESASPQRETVEQLAEEFVARYRRGERPPLTEYTERYPEHAEQIRDLFPALVMIEQIAPETSNDLASSPGLSLQQQTIEQPQQIGDYRILREIGRGGMGIVYEAEQVSLGRHVAVKVLPQQQLPNATQRQRFEREARAAAKLHHTNIVAVFGVGEDSGLHYYVMQYIQGLGLDTVLNELRRLRQEKGPASPGGQVFNLPEPRQVGNGPHNTVSAEAVAQSLLTGVFERPDAGSANEVVSDEAAASPAGDIAPEIAPLPTAAGSASVVVLPGSGSSGRKSHEEPYWYSVAHIGVQVAGALAYAHQQGVLHRDIKPANLLLDTHGTVWVTDFGLAKIADQPNLTHTGDVVGTLRYLAPEVFNSKADARSEVYALGLTLYELLSLRPAFDETDRNRLIRQVTAGDPARLDKLERGIPRDLVTIVHKAIDRDPEQRYSSAGELADDLQRFLADAPIKARRISVSEQFSRWCRRNKVVAGLTAAVAVLLVAGTITSLIAASYFRDLAADEKAARKDAQEAAATASAAQGTAEKRRQELRRQLYISDMNLASQLYSDGNIERLREVLDNHRPGSGETDLRRFEWFHWWRAAHLEVPIVPDRSRLYKGIAVSPDGQTVAVSMEGPDFLTYNSATKKMTERGRFPAERASSLLPAMREEGPLAFSCAGAILVMGGPDHRLHRWDRAAGKRLPALTASEQGREIVALAASSSTPLLASADDQGKIVLWDTDTWEPFPPLLAPGKVASLAFAPTGDSLLAGLQSGQIARISGWKSKAALQIDFPATARHPEQLPSQVGITGVAFCPDGSLFATGCADERVLLWNARTFQLVHTLAVAAPVTCVAFSADGKYVAAGTDKNNGIYLWDVQTRKQRGIIRGHSKRVRGVVFADAGKSLWSMSDDGLLKAWDLAHCQPFESISLPIARNSKIAFSPEGRTLLIHTAEETIQQWEFARQAPPVPWNHGERVEELAFSADGTLLVARSQGQALRLWDLAGNKRGEWPVTHRLRHDLDLPTQPLSVSRDGRTIAWTQPDGDAGKAGAYPLLGASTVGLMSSPQGPGVFLALSACYPGRTKAVVILDVATGKRTVLPVGREKPVRAFPSAVALSPDGKGLLCLHIFYTDFWRLDGAEPKHVMHNQASTYDVRTCVAFSPDGRQMVVGSWKNQMHFYSAETGELQQEVHGHAGDITCLAFDRNGSMLVSGSTDGTVRIWNPKTGDLCSTLIGHRGPITSLAVSPDGAAIASCSLDQTVRVWQTATPEQASRIQVDYWIRGEGHIDHGNWKEAADDLWRAVEWLPPGTLDWRQAAYHLAFVLAYLGETEKYQALCRWTVRDFRQTTNISTAEQTAKMCLFSRTVQDSEVAKQAGELADFAADHLEDAIAREEAAEWTPAFVQQAKGIAEYRRGNYTAALQWFQQSIRGMSLEMGWMQCSQATNLLFAAMAAHQMGETDRPSQWLAEADRLRATLPTPYNNTDRLITDMVRREAQALIEGHSKE